MLLPFLAVAGVLLAGYLAMLDRGRSARRLTALRDGWGKPRRDAASLEGPARYHDLSRARAGGEAVDAGTWRDLGMDAIFAKLDRTLSFAGRARLYDRVRRGGADAASLARFDAVATTFERDPEARERVQSALGAMDGYGQGAILDALFGELPGSSRMRYVFPVVGVLLALSLLASPFVASARVALFVLGVASVALRFVHVRRGLTWKDALAKTSALLTTGRLLALLPCAALAAELTLIGATSGRLAGFGRATSWLVLDASQMNDVLAIGMTYLNVFLLLDLTALAFALDALEERRDDVRSLFDAVGDLDAALSVASFRAGEARVGRPEIDGSAASIELEEAVHPLVEGAVPCSITASDRGVLVTGSNMSGKSTFVRTVAINALLAQTTATVLARRYRAPPLRVRTLMSASDDVERKKSYYLAEIEGARALLESSAPGTRTLVVLDELFRGTNTHERIAAGKAVLEALRGAGHFVFASTHDLELVTLLERGFDAYHFAEELVGREVVFPYELRRGPSRTRNAIALLERVGFPAEVVAEARAVAEGMGGR